MKTWRLSRVTCIFPEPRARRSRLCSWLAEPRICAVTPFELAAAAARATFVPPGAFEQSSAPGVFSRVPLHNLRGSPLMTPQIGHHLHRQINVPEEGLVTGTEIVQPRLSIRCLCETIFRA